MLSKMGRITNLTLISILLVVGLCGLVNAGAKTENLWYNFDGNYSNSGNISGNGLAAGTTALNTTFYKLGTGALSTVNGAASAVNLSIKNTQIGNVANTICAWTYLTTAPTGASCIAGIGSYNSGNYWISSYMCSYNTANDFLHYIENTGGFANAANSGYALPVDTWVHLCTIYTVGRNVQFFVNGTNIANDTQNGDLNLEATRSLK